MLVKDYMSKKPVVISKQTTLTEAARKMKELDTGFLPVGDDDRLDGVLTDRDIVIRALAENAGPDAKAGDFLSDKVLYCFEEDEIEDAANSMREQQVYRLVVLNNRKDKRLTGIISLGDISRKGSDMTLVGSTVEDMKSRKKIA